ncbi:phosphotransferase [Actinacidiphila glaucinigra]|uniref:Phosphotransferase enzyme family protein n=1 Tax=Actinacidiphila glaucinigra TaxID=235986 RepID=A0A239NA18_9ACTN|nr:phosphotransferase [Actinacidiphila glaucinigra]SNT51766.1 Phosphotransferase enzyme family protein [Actinacidiphila glaucinigra]
MRQFTETAVLSGIVREALGAGADVVGVDRLRGGSKKGVYRVHVRGSRAASVIVYSWAEGENFWPAAEGADAVHPFAPASGLVPFLAAQRTLERIGVRVPGLVLADDSRRRHPADVAVVEDIAGPTLEAFLRTDPVRASDALGELAAMLDVMYQQRSRHYGRVDVLERGDKASGDSCEQVVFERALEDLAEAAERDPRIGSAAAPLRDRLQELAARVAPRTEYRLIHGELGPDHVLLDAHGHPVLIDIEGLMFFDAEWEHVFLQLRFGERYPALSRPGLDPARLDLFMLAMRLSLVAGPLRILDGDFPHRSLMQGIADHNAREALALLAR